ncbi:transcriptional regulator with XRE-family HTH domain [Xanthobacter flavus]|uniref:Transcriptional regulator n=1 Tax=Xanthobacter flavus TaxID=281 RepID=A0A9W6CNG5_XANFL|nr:helix-turn-helix transcriptional regulator [Xanthobacter flavus]MDR6331948.1 transcriptional regulator with XRE-family HTH domain [Xanthobacter flavus]GLI25618.1 transcriptional regulator [Xanthobacter flavus]
MATSKVCGDTDRQIGARLRAARVARGMSQEKLAEAISLTFQQIQKYEKGTNRVSVSMLLRIAAVLEISAADLVPELKEGAGGAPVPVITNMQALEVARMVQNLRVPHHRRTIVEMVRTFTELRCEPVQGEEARAA